MNKKAIIALLLAHVVVAGQGQVKPDERWAPPQ